MNGDSLRIYFNPADHHRFCGELMDFNRLDTLQLVDGTPVICKNSESWEGNLLLTIEVLIRCFREQASPNSLQHSSLALHHLKMHYEVCGFLDISEKLQRGIDSIQKLWANIAPDNKDDKNNAQKKPTVTEVKIQESLKKEEIRSSEKLKAKEFSKLSMDLVNSLPFVTFVQRKSLRGIEAIQRKDGRLRIRCKNSFDSEVTQRAFSQYREYFSDLESQGLRHFSVRMIKQPPQSEIEHFFESYEKIFYKKNAKALLSLATFYSPEQKKEIVKTMIHRKSLLLQEPTSLKKKKTKPQKK